MEFSFPEKNIISKNCFSFFFANLLILYDVRKEIINLVGKVNANQNLTPTETATKVSKFDDTLWLNQKIILIFQSKCNQSNKNYHSRCGNRFYKSSLDQRNQPFKQKMPFLSDHQPFLNMIFHFFPITAFCKIVHKDVPSSNTQKSFFQLNQNCGDSSPVFLQFLEP